MLVVSRDREHARAFTDRESLQKHLKKKVAKLEHISTFDCQDSTLHYEACDYLSNLIQEKGTSPILKVDLTRTFVGDEYEAEEICLSANIIFE